MTARNALESPSVRLLSSTDESSQSARLQVYYYVNDRIDWNYILCSSVLLASICLSVYEYSMYATLSCYNNIFVRCTPAAHSTKR